MKKETISEAIINRAACEMVRGRVIIDKAALTVTQKMGAADPEVLSFMLVDELDPEGLDPESYSEAIKIWVSKVFRQWKLSDISEEIEELKKIEAELRQN